jgi:transposase
LVLCVGDREPKKGGVTARVYKEILEEELPRLTEPHLIFMQDNAPIYTSWLLHEWLSEQGYRVLSWPPYSPDLNAIENLWALLKEKILTRYSDLETMPKKDAALRKLCEAVTHVWLDIGQDLLDRLIDSMPRRVEAAY